LDESGFMLHPVRRRTWAPRGRTPIQRAWDRHDRLSTIAAITLSPERERLGVFFQIRAHNIRGPDMVGFLRALHRQLRRPIILVWDRYSVHRSAWRQLREAGCQWLRVEWLPGYAPDLNPVEAIWSHTKYSDLANYVPEDVDHLLDAVGDSLNDLHYDQRLLRSFLGWAELTS
jgi:transposase